MARGREKHEDEEDEQKRLEYGQLYFREGMSNSFYLYRNWVNSRKELLQTELMRARSS